MPFDAPPVKVNGYDNENLSRILWPVLLLTFIFFIHFLVRQITGPLLPAMEKDLRISHTQSGFFIMCMGVGFFFSQIGTAFWAGKWGYRRCILISLWGSAIVSAAIGLMGSVWTLYVGFLGLGFTGGLYVPSGIALITVMANPKDWGKVMGIHELAPNLALISVPFLATMAIYWGSWRWGYMFLASVLAILGVVYAFIGLDSSQRPSQPNFSRVHKVIADPSFWRLGLLLSLAVGVETGVYAMIPLFLVNDRAFNLIDANQLLGVSRIPGILMVLVSGWLTDRLNPAVTVSMALMVTGLAIIILGMGPDSWLTPAIFLQAAGAACLFPPILSLASSISTVDNRALTISLILAIAPVIGGGLIPLAIAFSGDLGSFATGLTGAGILTVAGIFLVKR